MLTSKATLLCILKILQKYSDEDHPLTAQKIIERMSQDYLLNIERKAVYRNIETLRDFGYEIELKDNIHGYYLSSRIFEPSEIHLLADAVFSSRFIPVKASKELTEKMQSLLSVYQSKPYKNLRYIQPNYKSENQEFFLDIERLDEAITEHKKISLYYFRYSLDKKLVLRKQKKYLVSPYALVWANSNYYLVCNYDPFDDISHFRVDKMRDIEILDEQAKPAPDHFDAYEYTNSRIYMFGGEVTPVTLRCDMIVLDEIIERFGKNVLLRKADDHHFDVRIHTATEAIKFWVLQYSSLVEVISPKSFRQTISEALKEASEKYQGSSCFLE